ncbi:MAG: flippase, partial [Cetobacterium sp.]
MSSVSKNYLLNIVMTITGILFPVITFPYISRVLMPEYVGKVTFSQSFVFYFITLALLGIPVYGTRELSKNKGEHEREEFKKIFTELLVIGVIGSIISFIGFNIILQFSKQLQENRDIFRYFSLQVLFSFLTLDYVFIVLEQHKRRALRSLFMRFLSVILLFLLVKNPEDYKVYVLILVVPELLMRVFDLYTLRSYINLKEKIQLKRHMKSLLILFISAISVSLYVSLDSTMLGFMRGDIEVGLYTSGSKMSRILIPIIVSLSTVIGPKLIYSIKNGEKEKVFRNIDMFLDFNFMLGIQFIFILYIISKETVLLFSGDKFIGATGVMQILLPVIFFIPVGSFMSGSIIISHGLEKLSLRFNFISMISNALLNYFLIPKFGIMGAGFATMSTEGIACILKSTYVKKLYPDYMMITKKRMKYIFLGIISMGITAMIKTRTLN